MARPGQLSYILFRILSVLVLLLSITWSYVQTGGEFSDIVVIMVILQIDSTV